ncbi:MAG: Asp-tRNA(Asn)/Glu-tRNA(Gln) amidotransferase subunit GatC [Bordetella sp.]|nr:MAG: Asp-tRNA(Asn)/Glu-tRNA(Gln) amidotransferase subunit GatC [Bordetella sp.]
MNTINDHILKQIANLAKIDLLPSEEAFFQKDLNAIIKLINLIQSIEIKEIDHPILSNFTCSSNNNQNLRFRDDIPNNMNSKKVFQEIFKNAPEIQENLFLVPKVIKNS